MLKRRTFLQAGATTGGALMLGFSLFGCGDDGGSTPAADAQPTPADAGPDAAPLPPPVLTEVTAYVIIGSDDSVTLMVGKQEMGQGVLTALPMILAEELDVDWTKVRSEHAVSNAAKYGFQATFGSSSIRDTFEPLRIAGAAARQMLIAAAAQTWDVSPEECRTELGVVYHDASNRQARYGELAEVAATLEVPAEPTLKNTADFRIIGTPVKRLDTRAKAAGTATYALDIRLPNMAVAQIAHSPVFGGTVASVDDSAAREIPGVQDVVQISSGVAVVADHYWAAEKGRAALNITWNEGANRTLTTQSIFATMRAAVDNGVEVVNVGDAEGTIAAAAQSVDLEYELPYLSHASMEPLSCTVDFRGDTCEIWASTQAPVFVHGTAAQITGLPMDKITVHTPMLGGGFGRRAQIDVAVEALQLAVQIQKPVKLVWKREDDIRGGFYRPMVYARVRGSLDAKGYPNAWQHKAVSPLIPPFYNAETGIDASAVEGVTDTLYSVPNVHITYANPEINIPAWVWRSVGHSQNGFIVETFMDELAALGNKDPFEMRRRLLTNQPRHTRVLDRLAELADWGRKLPAGMAQGMAVHHSFETHAGQVAEVSIDDNGQVRVHRVVCVIDCGVVVNPSIVEAQVQSSIIYGLSAGLWGQININNGQPVESNFYDYRVMRIGEAPEIEVHIIAEGDEIGGMGEPALPPAMPAVANALYRLTNTRIRKLPVGLVKS